MKEKLMRMKNSFLALFLLPFVCGCQGGGLGLGALGNLFAFSSGGGGGIEGGIGLLASNSAHIATIVNPEPTSMLLMGGGLIAMKYLRKKAKD